MNNMWHVYYDSDKNIIAITNELRATGDYFSIEESRVTGFIQGTQNIADYIVTVTNLNFFAIDKRYTTPSETVYKDIIVVPVIDNTLDLDIAIIHSDTQWLFKLSDALKTQGLEKQHSTKLKFYIAKNTNLNHLIRTIEFTVDKVVSASYAVDFLTDYEKDLNQISVISRKYFDHIGVVHE